MITRWIVLRSSTGYGEFICHQLSFRAGNEGQDRKNPNPALTRQAFPASLQKMRGERCGFRSITLASTRRQLSARHGINGVTAKPARLHSREANWQNMQGHIGNLGLAASPRPHPGQTR